MCLKLKYIFTYQQKYFIYFHQHSKYKYYRLSLVKVTCINIIFCTYTNVYVEFLSSANLIVIHRGVHQLKQTFSPYANIYSNKNSSQITNEFIKKQVKHYLIKYFEAYCFHKHFTVPALRLNLALSVASSGHSVKQKCII